MGIRNKIKNLFKNDDLEDRVKSLEDAIDLLQQKMIILSEETKKGDRSVRRFG